MRRMRIIRNLDDDTSNYKRRLKSLTERILLIDTELIYGVYYNSIDLFDSISGVNCKILGSKNTTYNICISKENDNINCTCSCPDYVQRKEYCKHIFWLGSRKFENMEPIYWDNKQYEKFITECWILDNNYKGRNDNCPICLDPINYEDDNTICCKYECHNSVHAICWNRFYCDTMPIIE